jgi:hypothetical protein
VHARNVGSNYRFEDERLGQRISKEHERKSGLYHLTNWGPAQHFYVVGIVPCGYKFIFFFIAKDPAEFSQVSGISALIHGLC